MQTLKSILNILKEYGYLDYNSDFLNNNCCIKFDTVRSDEVHSLPFKENDFHIHLPILSTKILIGKSLRTIYIHQIRDDFSNKIRYEIKPSIQQIKLMCDRNATEFSDCKVYGVGDYCIHKNKLYICKATIPSRMNFNKSYWDEAEPLKATFIFECMDLPQHFIESNLYKHRILSPYIYRCLEEHHNSVMSLNKLYAGIEQYGSQQALLKEFKKLLGYEIKFVDGLGAGYKIIEDVNLENWNAKS